MKKTTITMINTKKGELPFVEVRSGKRSARNLTKTTRRSLSPALNALFAYVIFALGFMMLGAAITLQVLAR